MSIYKKFEHDPDAYNLTEEERMLARLLGLTEPTYRTMKLIEKIKEQNPNVEYGFRNSKIDKIK